MATNPKTARRSARHRRAAETRGLALNARSTVFALRYDGTDIPDDVWKAAGDLLNALNEWLDDPKAF